MTTVNETIDSDTNVVITTDDLPMTTSEAARHIGISAGSVRKYSDEGKLRHITTVGGYRFFLFSDVDAFKRDRDANPPQRGGYRPRRIA